MSMSVTVLCPNGRRVNVKVTPNTSILQLIEDACKREKFDPDVYDIKHLQRTLDTSSTVRYSNLPNKCQLELVKSTVPRTASSVTVNIASDTGMRFVHDFPANTSLWDILSHHEEQGNKGTFFPSDESDMEPVIVYTMRRINGAQLKSTTLKSLGLTGGKCMFRHSFQKVSTQGQAHVSTPLARAKLQKDDDINAQSQVVLQNDLVQHLPSRSVPEDTSARPSIPQTLRQENQPSESVCSGEQNSATSSAEMSLGNHPDVLIAAPDVVQPQNGVLQPDVVANSDRRSQSPPPMPMDILEGHDGTSSASVGATSSSYVPNEEDEAMQCEENIITVNKLGSHDAFLFSMDDAPSTDFSIDDDGNFFNLTLDEVKGLYREQLQAIRSIDDAPLMTKGMREMHETSKVLAALNQFPVTQLRIHFPDNNVIQASFKPTEKVSAVIEFVRQFLSCPNADFNLCMRYPTRDLNPEATLVEADCVPNARLYFTSSSQTTSYINEETLSKKSSFNSTHTTLKNQRTRRPFSRPTCSEETAAGSSNQGISNHEMSLPKRANTNMPATGAVKKYPKWLKLAK